MVKKRGNDNVYERQRKRSSIPTTPTSNVNEKNAMNDCLLDLYRQNASSAQKSAETPEKSNSVKKERDTVEDFNALIPPKKQKKSKALTLTYPSIKFDKVGGMKEIIKELVFIFLHLRIPTLYQKAGTRSPRGILLHGPSGCGKTLLAHAIAGQWELPLIEISATELVCGISGESETKLRDTFNEALQVGRCILFIDEIDAIFPKKENAAAGMEKRMVSQVLKCFDELNAKDEASNVMVIGATSIPDSIDPGLRGGDRFSREIAIGIPNEDSRLHILQILCKDMQLEPNFDLSWVAHHTPGFVGADLKSLISKVVEIGMWRIQTELLKSTSNISFSDATQEDVLNWFETVTMTEEELDKICFKLEDFQNALQNCVPNCKREGFAAVPDVTWEEIGALDNVKKELRNTILWPVKNRKYCQDNNLSFSKGILLHGPKGCGKTLLAKALANECNINFLCVNGPELLNMYLGESERAVRRCFERARHSEPCVIFFDEFDALCPARKNSNSNAAAERVVNTLLTEMDGMQERKQVYVIAATNRKEKIDSAMLRPGRLDKSIYVDLPTPAGREEILKSLSENKTKPKMADDVDLHKIAFDERCNEFSGADLAYLIKEATKHAIEEIIDTPVLNTSFILKMCHFDKAFEVVHPSFNEHDRKYFEKHRLDTEKGF